MWTGKCLAQSIKLNLWIDTELCVSLISEPIKLNATNQSVLNPVH